MKKLMALMLVAVMVPCAFAQNAQEKAKAGALQKALSQSAAKAATSSQKVAQLKKDLENNVKAFAEFAYRQQYSDYSYLFQALDDVRVSYIELRKVSVAAAREMVNTVNQEIKINNGKNSIRIANYVRMESCVLGSTSQREMQLWDDWSNMLEVDLKAAPKKGVVTADTPLAEGLPRDFAYGVEGFRSFVGNSQKMNANWVLQSMMTAMDTFNAYKKKGNVEQLEAMAKEFVKPVQSGWGETVYPIDFIIKHTCKLYGTVQYDLWQFASDLDALSR